MAVAVAAFVVAAPVAVAETKTHAGAQVQFDVRDDWNVKQTTTGLVLSDPGTNLILVVEILETSALESALKDADALIKKNFERVRWHKKPVSRELNGMKALAFEGAARLKQQDLDVGAMLLITPASKVMLVYGFMATSQSGALQPQVDAFLDSIRPIARRAPEPPPQTRTASSGNRTPAPRGESDGPPAATGFATVYLPPSTQRFQDMLRITRQADLETFIDVLNRTIVMPRLVPIRILECGATNAAYSPADHAIFVCYEIVELFLHTMPAKDTSRAALEKRVAGLVKFTLMHEIAHALSSELDLPIAGKEEDAADEFASILLPLEGDRGFEAADAAMYWFAAIGSEKEKAGHITWYDEHSFDLQRMYDIICILYGANPQRYGALAGQLGLPAERLARCTRDYQRKVSAWNTLLGSHRRS